MKLFHVAQVILYANIDHNLINKKMLSKKIYDLLDKLLQEPSVTPDVKNCFTIIQEILEPMGYVIEYKNQNGTSNMFARKGIGKRHLCFVGHVDVVPTGDFWSVNPFALTIKDEKVYGRGTADMKGAVALWISALEQYNDLVTEDVSLSILLTSDEEADGTYGLKWFLPQLKETHPDVQLFLIGEPTGFRRDGVIGQCLFNGRRGSMTFVMKIQGRQGHIACPEVSINPLDLCVEWINGMNHMILELNDCSTWNILADHESAEHKNCKHKHQKDDNCSTWNNTYVDPVMAPTIFRVTSIDANNLPQNVTPGQCMIRFGIRYNSSRPKEFILEKITQLCEMHIAACGGSYELDIKIHGDGYYTAPENKLAQQVKALLENSLQKTVFFKSNEGTTDGRFIPISYPGIPVLELGFYSDTIHQVDEHVYIQDIEQLSQHYDNIVENWIKGELCA